jgi:DNA repair exonuclease SbcCD ATPase subunit
MPEDLKNVIDGIESNEKETAVFQSKIDHLQEILEKQKRVIHNQDIVIEEQKIKITRMYDIPEDVLELKELIGTQRALLNERESEHDLAKGEVLAIEKELEFMKRQNIPTQKRLDESFETIGNLKAESAERKSELILKDGKIKSIENKVKELQAFADKLQDEQVKLLTDMDQKWKKELEKLRTDHIEEKQDLISKISDLDTFLLDSKLVSTEASSEAKDMKSRFGEIRTRQENLIKKLEDALEKKREADEVVRKLNSDMEGLREFKKNNLKKIHYYDKLTELMEHETQFKAFLILEQVGSMAMEDLRNALGSPIVLVKKIVQNLQDVDLVDINDAGKIVVKKIDEN